MVMKIKNIPNMITSMRILISVVLLFLNTFSVVFFILYAIGGISDALDGYIARKTKNTSKFGATLDSIADFVFISILLIIFIPKIDISIEILIWIIGVVLVRLCSILIGFLKYRALAFLHTYSNKATGFLLFCFPFLFSLFGMTVTASLLCIMASISAIEELAINILSKELSQDIKSIFAKKE